MFHYKRRKKYGTHKKIQIRTSEDFYDLLNHLANKYEMSKTDFIIKRILDPHFTTVQIQERRNEEMKLYASVSNNINQIARSVHSLVKEYKMLEHKPLSEYSKEFVQFTIVLDEVVKQMKALDDREVSLQSGLMKYGYLNKKKYLDEDVVEYLERYRPEYLHDILNGEAEVK